MNCFYEKSRFLGDQRWTPQNFWEHIALAIFTSDQFDNWSAVHLMLQYIQSSMHFHNRLLATFLSSSDYRTWCLYLKHVFWSNVIQTSVYQTRIWIIFRNCLFHAKTPVGGRELENSSLECWKCCKRAYKRKQLLEPFLSSASHILKIAQEAPRPPRYFDIIEHIH